jgi:hypothetical protein
VRRERPQLDLSEQSLAGALRNVLQGLQAVLDLHRAQSHATLLLSHVQAWYRQISEVLGRFEER